jgi:hypothetical protein
MNDVAQICQFGITLNLSCEADRTAGCDRTQKRADERYWMSHG